MALRIQANGQLAIKLIAISIAYHKKKTRIVIRHCKLFEYLFSFLSLNSNYLLKKLLFEEFGMNLFDELEEKSFISINLSNKFRLNVYLRDRLILVFFHQI